jgi:putative MFS transporter
MRIPAIDDAAMTRFHRKLTWACAGGPVLDGYLLSIIGIALIGMGSQLHLTTLDLSLIGAAASSASSSVAWSSARSPTESAVW